MMEDIEDTEGLHELEAQLYAQQHHEAADNAEHSSHEQNMNSTGKENPTISVREKSNVTSCRYWTNQNNGNRSAQHKRRNSYPNSKQHKSSMKLNPCSLSAAVKSKVNQNVSTIESSKERVEVEKAGNRPFRPYTSVLSNEGTLFPASEESPNLQGSNENNSKKHNNKRKDKDPKDKNQRNKSKTVNEARPIEERHEKLSRTIKLEMKKFRAKLVKEVTKRNCFETIILESSDEENDVIEVPVTPPPLVTIDDSSEGEVENEKENVTENTENNSQSVDDNVTQFAKPQNIDKPKDQRENSRCTTPNSVISDDFIVLADRTRLRVNDSTITIDEDMLCIQETVDQRLQREKRNKNPSSPVDSSSSKETQNSSNDADKFVTPSENRTNSKKRPAVERNYQVNESGLPAIDVYESESSDMPESVYQKAEKELSKDVAPNEEGCSDIEEVEFIPRIKRLRKRKRSTSSSTNKNNEHYSGTGGDSDAGAATSEEEEDDNMKTNVPFISKGEAVETHKIDFKRRMKTNTTGHLSDNEFYNKISTMSKGGAENDSSEEESGKSDEDITARKIAENVLNKRKQKKNTNNTVETKNEDTLNISAGTVEDENEAIPKNTLDDIQHLLNKINEIGKKQAEGNISNESDKEEENDNLDCDEAKELFVLDSLPENRKRRKSKTREQSFYESSQKRLEEVKGNETNDNDLEVVYSDRPFVGWNEEMISFYDKSWGQQNFSIPTIRKKMIKGSEKWKILPLDRYPKISRFNKMKCFNCCEFGHQRARCPRPLKPIVCFMCGETGHREPRCPNTCCLRCGSKTSMFTKICNMCSNQKSAICFICKIRGHSVQMCPDKWRRYHSTTTPNEYPSRKVTYNKRKFCCVCAQHGHLAENCRNFVRFSEYPTSVSEIKSFAKSYEDTIFINTPAVSDMRYNLVSRPDDDVAFKFSQNKLTLNQCYGRFLKSVDLGHMLRSSRDKSQTEKSSIDYNKEIVQIEDKKDENDKRRAKKDYLPNPFATRNENMQKIIEKPYTEQQNDKNDNDQNNDDILINTINVSSRKTNARSEDTCEGNSDSNYSFSEHFADDSTSTPKPKSCEKLNIIETSLEQNDLTKSLPENEIINSKENIQADNENETQEEHSALLSPQNNTAPSSDKECPPPPSFVLSGVAVPEGIIPQSSHEKIVTLLPSKERECRKVGPLPDFIPLESNETQSNFSQGSNSENTEVIEIDAEMNTLSNTDKTCHSNDDSHKGKIYLTDFHSRFLLSPNGQKFLEDTAKKYDIKPSINSSSLGTVLVLEGLWYKQNEFHKELLVMFSNLSDNLKRKELERTQRLPRKREILVKILQDNILQLKSNLGNVGDVFKRLETLRKKDHSKSNWRSAERARRTLNMILIGQVGLANGQESLKQLHDYIRKLIENCKDENVSEELREEIEQHWKVIFTSFPQENYDALVKKYFELQRNRALPKLELDYRVLNEKVIDVNFTQEQEMLLKKPFPQQIQENEKKGVTANQFIPPPPRFSNELSHISAGPSSSGSTFTSNGNQEVNRNMNFNPFCGDKNRNPRHQQFNAHQNRNRPFNRRNRNNRKQGQDFSQHTVWSRKCMKLANELTSLINLKGRRNDFLGGLRRVEYKARRGQLSERDYKVLEKIRAAINS